MSDSNIIAFPSLTTGPKPPDPLADLPTAARRRCRDRAEAYADGYATAFTGGDVGNEIHATVYYTAVDAYTTGYAAGLYATVPPSDNACVEAYAATYALDDAVAFDAYFSGYFDAEVGKRAPRGGVKKDRPYPEGGKKLAVERTNAWRQNKRQERYKTDPAYASRVDARGIKKRLTEYLLHTETPADTDIILRGLTTTEMVSLLKKLMENPNE